MATAVFTSFGQQLDGNGVPLSGGSVTVYAAGTTTPLALFSDDDLNVAASNPITLDAFGRHAMTYFAPVAYKVLVKDSAGVTQYTRDDIDPGVPIGTGALGIENGGTGATTAPAALSNLGGATADELADLSAEVATLSGTLASTEKTHIATGTTAQRTTSPVEGDIRRNTTTGEWEGYEADWVNFKTSQDSTSTANVTSEAAEDTYLRPDRLKHSQRVAKAWGRVGVSGGTPTLSDGFNISASITDNGVGDYTFSFSTALPNANYCVVATTLHATLPSFAFVVSQSTTQIRIRTIESPSSSLDVTALFFVVFGDFS